MPWIELCCGTGQCSHHIHHGYSGADGIHMAHGCAYIHFAKMYGFVGLRIGYPSLYYNHFLINTAILYNGIIYPSISRHTHMLVLRKPGLYCYHLPWSAIWSPGIPQVEDRILRSWNVELASLVVNVLLRHERYSTCTLNKWENEGICQQLLRSVEDCERISLDDVLGASVDSSGQGALEPPVATPIAVKSEPKFIREGTDVPKLFCGRWFLSIFLLL